MAEEQSVLKVPERNIPVPAHVSPEAQAWLSMPPRGAASR